MNEQIRKFSNLIFDYKYHLVSTLLLLIGLHLLSISDSAKIPECNNPNILQKLKYEISSKLSSEKFSSNKITSIFDISEIDKPSSSDRSCRAGLTIDGSELGNVNYKISVSAPGSKEIININTSLD